MRVGIYSNSCFIMYSGAGHEEETGVVYGVARSEKEGLLPKTETRPRTTQGATRTIPTVTRTV